MNQLQMLIRGIFSRLYFQDILNLGCFRQRRRQISVAEHKKVQLEELILIMDLLKTTDMPQGPSSLP